jgi:cytoskeletal protein CcmA (bactofilin family)
MFSRVSKDGSVPPPTKSIAAPSIISADLRITGNFESDGDIQIDGTVDGDIRSGRISISESAVVKGSLEAESVRIAGKVTGQVKARQVTLMKTAKVVADVMQESLAIEPGASFEGNCRHYARDATSTRRVEQLLPPTLPRKGPVEAPKSINGGGAKAGEAAT